MVVLSSDDSLLFYVDSKYDSIYENEELMVNMKIKDLFLIAVTVGFRNSLRVPLTQRGRKQFRSQYLKPDEESLLYNILLEELGNGSELEPLTIRDNRSTSVKIIEEYANGGMKLILEDGFSDKWDGEELSKEYKHYHYDLCRYLYAQMKEVPF